MDILEAAFGVGFRTEAKELFELVIPGGRNPSDLEFAGEEGSLDFEAKENVEVVGGFIGIDTDWGVGAAVDGGEEIIERNFAKVGKEALGAGIPLFPEGAGATDVVLPESGL